MSYVVTMMTLLINAKDDMLTQNRINAARIKYARDSQKQLELDRSQAALDKVRKRNLQRISEIARLN